VSELNAEYVESVVKLGLIERKKSLLSDLGFFAMKLAKGDLMSNSTLLTIESIEECEALIRDQKNLKQISERVVKASREQK
jgi:hypothetical protein